MPDINDLTRFIGRRHGKETDLISYFLDSSINAQKNAGITEPCGGGLYYTDRIRETISGGSGGLSDPDMKCFARDGDDIAMIMKNAAMALPAPHILDKPEKKRTDADETAIFRYYKKILRTMRDHHIKRHIIHATRIIQDELEILSSQKVLFALMTRNLNDIELLLEYQRDLVITEGMIGEIGTLSEQYDIRRYIVLDPEPDMIIALLAITDQDQIRVAGYAQGEEESYWTKIQEKAEILL